MPSILSVKKVEESYPEMDPLLKVYNVHGMNEIEKIEFLRRLNLPLWIFDRSLYRFYDLHSIHYEKFPDENAYLRSSCYNMHDDIQGKQFYFTAKNLNKMSGKSYFAYTIFCFADFDYSYIIEMQFYFFPALQGYPRDYFCVTLKEFLLASLRMFQDFESKHIVCTLVKSYSTFLFVREDPAQLRFSFENDFYEEGQECYVKRYKFWKIKTEAKNLPVLFNSEDYEYFVAKADPLWNKYKLVFLVRYFIKYIGLSPGRAFLIKLKEYYRRIYSSEREEMSWEELEQWVDELDNFDDENIIEKELMPKRAFNENASEDSDEEYFG